MSGPAAEIMEEPTLPKKVRVRRPRFCWIPWDALHSFSPAIRVKVIPGQGDEDFIREVLEDCDERWKAREATGDDGRGLVCYLRKICDQERDLHFARIVGAMKLREVMLKFRDRAELVYVQSPAQYSRRLAIGGRWTEQFYDEHPCKILTFTDKWTTLSLYKSKKLSGLMKSYLELHFQVKDGLWHSHGGWSCVYCTGVYDDEVYSVVGQDSRGRNEYVFEAEMAACWKQFPEFAKLRGLDKEKEGKVTVCTDAE